MTGAVSQICANTEEPRAAALVAQAGNFLGERVVPHIPQDYPRELALIVKVDGRRVAAFTHTLASLQSQNGVFMGEFYNRGIEGLERVLQRLPLNANSTVQLDVMDIKHPTYDDALDDPALNLQWAGLSPWTGPRPPTETLGSYNTFTANLSSSPPQYEDRHDMGILRRSVDEIIQRIYDSFLPEETALQNYVIGSLDLRLNARTGWRYADPSIGGNP